ncbi:hypothetical protein ACP4OV_026380 [Aristida adscensionis]
MDIESQLSSSISKAHRDAERLPAALVSSGVGQAAAVFGLCVFKALGGIFLRHGEAAVYLYYGILIAILIFGLFEAFAGLWVSGDLINRRAVGKTIMWISVLPCVVVGGLGGLCHPQIAVASSHTTPVLCAYHKLVSCAV